VVGERGGLAPDPPAPAAKKIYQAYFHPAH
jgi:hypothetical protein